MIKDGELLSVAPLTTCDDVTEDAEQMHKWRKEPMKDVVKWNRARVETGLNSQHIRDL